MEREIIARRGFSAIAPENTLAAFAAALETGADSIECDVQLSADGIPILIHDAHLNRTTGTGGIVREKTLSELKTLDAGAWFSPEFAGESIPTLREALNFLRDLPKFLYLDVKQTQNWSDTELYSFIRTIIESGWQNRCIVACFNHHFLAQVRAYSSQITLGYLLESLPGDMTQLAISDRNAIVLSQYQLLLNNPSVIQTLKNQGMEIVAWTVDQHQDLQELAALGVGRIITNCLMGRGEP